MIISPAVIKVVRVWFCNRRQKEKRMLSSAVHVEQGTTHPYQMNPEVNMQQLLQAAALQAAAASTTNETVTSGHSLDYSQHHLQMAGPVEASSVGFYTAGTV